MNDRDLGNSSDYIEKQIKKVLNREKELQKKKTNIPINNLLNAIKNK